MELSQLLKLPAAQLLPAPSASLSELKDETAAAVQRRKDAEMALLEIEEKEQALQGRWHLHQHEKSLLTESQDSHRMVQSPSFICAQAPVDAGKQVTGWMAKAIDKATSKVKAANAEVEDVKAKWEAKTKRDADNAWRRRMRELKKQAVGEKRAHKEAWRQIEEEARQASEKRETTKAMQAQQNNRMAQDRLRLEAMQYRADELAAQEEREYHLSVAKRCARLLETKHPRACAPSSD